MQQKFKIGDKVKVLTNVYPVAYGTEGVVKQVDTKSPHVYVVEHGICDGQMDYMYGHFDHDAWRYCFCEFELELVEDKPKTKFKAGDKVVCVRGNEYHNAFPFRGEHYVVTDAYIADGFEYVVFGDGYKGGWDVDRFELVTDQEVSNIEPNVQITVNIDENICAAFNEVKNGLEILLSGKPEPNYTIGQEVYVSNDFNRYLRKGILLDAIPRNGLMHVNIGGFDCFVEEERVYTKEVKGD